MLLSVLLSWYSQTLWPISLIAAISLITFVFSQTSIKGYANYITGFRFLMIVVFSWYVDIFPIKWMFGYLTIAVLLDVLDGYVARKYGETSVFGQYFDMEVDAFFVLLMCSYYYLYQGVPFWILIPGVLRYVYSLFLLIYPKPGFVEKKKSYAATIAGAFFVILLGGLLLNDWYQTGLLLIGSLLIVLSFTISFFEYSNYKHTLL